MAGIDDQDTHGKEVRLLKEIFHERAPAAALVAGNAGVAVAGKVDEICPVHKEIVDLHRLSRRRADMGVVFPVEQTVDDRRFADVGTPGERDGMAAVAQKRLFVRGGFYEIYFLCIHSATFSSAGRSAFFST